MRSRCTNSASAARLFVQLSKTCAQQPSQRAPLDILLPASARRFHSGLVVPRPRVVPSASHFKSSPAPTSSLPKRTAGACAAAPTTMTRSFGSTSARQMTQAIYNPQKDEDGNDMVLEITPRAANRLSQIMEKDKNPYLALRIQVESGGCHGFQYLMSLTTLPASLHSGSGQADATPPSPQATAEAGENSTTTDTAASEPGVGEEDTVFAFVKEGGEVDSLATGPKIVLDAPSLELLKGSKVDYTMELIGSQFKIVDNPLASSSCGCGTSFDIKA
ncbi:mitochondrial protein required for iron metabolism [Apiospora marii]|uniref:Mitochondrial protein required for iron metabolism n=1 Tax=Apiospora marii TaxID=335849 RepID=A0ABR1RQH3_9PEZI